MKTSKSVHTHRPWRVHTLAADFELLDVWRFDVGDRPPELPSFLTGLWSAMAGLEGSRLARARLRIGRALGWDDHDFTLPIPGCTETTVAARLTPADRARTTNSGSAESPLETPQVKVVYEFEDEALFELSNDTIHALLHVGLRGRDATLAVYIKSRGAFSRLYMAAIKPFRHAFVYPALIRRVEASLAA